MSSNPIIDAHKRIAIATAAAALANPFRAVAESIRRRAMTNEELSAELEATRATAAALEATAPKSDPESPK